MKGLVNLNTYSFCTEDKIDSSLLTTVLSNSLYALKMRGMTRQCDAYTQICGLFQAETGHIRRNGH